jgi:lipid-A-disaccharide synthase-like uncharacterized protein
LFVNNLKKSLLWVLSGKVAVKDSNRFLVQFIQSYTDSPVIEEIYHVVTFLALLDPVFYVS